MTHRPTTTGRGFPAYDNGDGPTATSHRHTFFDLDTGPLPGHLVEGLLDAMSSVYGNDGPHILLQDPPFSATDPNTGNPDGRPNEPAMAQMWEIVYRYLKMSSSDAISLRLPPPPSVFTDHSFPTPPGGGGSGIDDDPSRGADVDDDDSFSLLDLLLALFAWIVYIGQVIVWLLTVLPGLIIDITTFPAREVIYWAVIVPLWNLYLLARRALVMSGFAMPKPAEINPGLTTLGNLGTYDIASALDNPLGMPSAPRPITEPSGRLTSTDPRGLDHAYPRGIVRDLPSAISRPDLVGALGLTGPLRYRGDATSDEFKPSEWIAPWRYPLTNQAGAGVAQEGAETHAGPYVVGTNSTILLSALLGDNGARASLEKAASPADTETALNLHLPNDQHLGGPVDYGLYLVGRMAVAAQGRPGRVRRPRLQPRRRPWLRLALLGLGPRQAHRAPRTSIPLGQRTTRTGSRAPRRSSSTPTTTCLRCPTSGTSRPRTSPSTTCPGTGHRSVWRRTTTTSSPTRSGATAFRKGGADHAAQDPTPWQPRQRAPRPHPQGGRGPAGERPARFLRARRPAERRPRARLEAEPHPGRGRGAHQGARP